MPQVLYEGTGLRIVKNDINGFAVATLHHTADPSKRGDAWRREAAQGMTPEQFAREFDIDYTAVMGSKVFPEMATSRKAIVCAPVEFPTDQRFWAGFDYGPRNPSSFHVYTMFQDILYSCWELYEPCKNVPEFVSKLRGCPFWGNIRYIAADPSIWAPTQQQREGSLTSIHKLLWDEGVRNLLKGRNDPSAEQAWIAMVRKHWNQDEPTFRIFDTCPSQIHEFEVAIYTNQSQRQLMSASYYETIADVNNHSLDDCKYCMLSMPAAQAPKVYEIANMVDKWGQNSHGAKAPQYTGRKPVGGYN